MEIKRILYVEDNINKYMDISNLLKHTGMDFDDFEDIIEKQGVLLLPWNKSEQEKEMVRRSPLFYLNFITKLKNN